MNFIRNIILPNMGEKLLNCLKYRKNKELAYKEGFKEFLDRAKTYYNNGIEYKIHENVNMYLDVSGKCTGRCKFCIANTLYDRGEINHNYYIEKFEEGYLGLKPTDPSVQIVGGEPTLWYGLPKLLYKIKELGCRFPVLGTNGQGLESHFDSINNSSLEWINISRHHYNDRENIKIMGGNVLDNFYLEQALKKIKKPIRLQCNMIAGFIDTYGEIMQMIAFAYQKFKIKNIVFALLTPLPKNSFYNKKIISYIENRPVNGDSILDKIQNDSRFNFEKYRGGVACYYEVWRYNGYDEPITIIFKYSDNEYLELADKIVDCIPDIIMHTDATICGSWNKSIKILKFN